MAESTNLPAIAIVGRPNVGKSALFNRLVGRNIAIVHDQPGITRDRISGICSRGPRPFRVWDTGGIVGAGESELASAVRGVADEAIAQSDLVLFLVDARHGLSPMDEELARMLRRMRKPVLVVVNKVDTEKHETLAGDFDSLGFTTVLTVSAAHGRNMLDLLEAIERLLPSEPESSPPTTQVEEGDEAKAEPPLAIAIVGRPNVGKSSLINAIIQTQRAIVSEQAGTTRDAVDITYERGAQRFVFIDTAGIRRRGAHSSSVEVFSVMRAERSIRRADLCILIVDITSGVTAQDKRIAGMIQKANRPCIVLLNKWDLVKPRADASAALTELVKTARQDMFFLGYAPILVASAMTGENVERLFRVIDQVRGAARRRIGTGILNRLLRTALDSNPPPLVSGKRLKLFYATQSTGPEKLQKTGEPSRPKRAGGSGKRLSALTPPEFILFVNNPGLLSETYGRYLEAQLREAQPYPGLPITLALRHRPETARPSGRPGGGSSK